MRAPRPAAFTLVELMLSTAVLSLLILMLVGITNQTGNTWRYANGKVEQFRGARDGFESLTRRLSQATLNTYYDYFNAAGEARTPANAATFVPKNYGRQSELRFICGAMDRENFYGGARVPALALDPTRSRPTHGIFFHAPLGLVEETEKHGGLQSLLNSWGYYVEFANDRRERPPFLRDATNIAPLRWRYRLMEFMQPSEQMMTYTKPEKWFEPMVNAPDSTACRNLADNIVALVIQPALAAEDERKLTPRPKVEGTALAPTYFYDSTQKNTNAALNPRHQLPPFVRVTLVAIDESSALRLSNGEAMPDFGLTDLFATDQPGAAERYNGDLKTLEDKLSTLRCSYRVFTTNVAIRGAKWSSE